MRFAYADPPYLGYAKFYKDHPEHAVYDTLAGHVALFDRLMSDYSDGWAVSCTSGNLRDLFPITPVGTRVAAWVKPFASFKPGVAPAYAWEPVLFYGGRKRTRKEQTPRDWHSENITLRKGLVGAKPPGFARWLLDLLNVRADLGDTIDDLFPGTGGVLSAWRIGA